MSAAAIKQKLINEIMEMEDVALLNEVYLFLHDLGGVRRVISLNAEQKALIKEARAEYKKGNYHTTEEVFKGLIDE